MGRDPATIYDPLALLWSSKYGAGSFLLTTNS